MQSATPRPLKVFRNRQKQGFAPRVIITDKPESWRRKILKELNIGSRA